MIGDIEMDIGTCQCMEIWARVMLILHTWFREKFTLKSRQAIC